MTTLTQRQKIILELYRQGLTQKQIAKKLGTWQGCITKFVCAIKRKSPELAKEIKEIQERNRERVTPELTQNWKEALKELGI